MQAIENEPIGKDSSSSFTGQLLQRGTLHLFTPIPLGEQRERFLALTDDIHRRRDDYTSQLSMLTLAGMNDRKRTESKNEILATLLQSGNIESKNEGDDQLLWQSRLMLKLGEFFDAEQADLNEALHNISSRQDDLLAELREETDDPFSQSARLYGSGHKTEGILQHRLKAWSRLYFQGAAPAQPQVFITCHETVLDTLQEIFAKNHRQTVTRIASLELPAKLAPLSSDSFVLDPLIDKCPGLQAALAVLTAVDGSSSSQTEEVTKLFTGCAAEWSHCLDTRYPGGQFGRCTLDLFLFPAISARQLFLESFTGGSPAEGSTGCSGTLIGLLRGDGHSV